MSQLSAVNSLRENIGQEDSYRAYIGPLNPSHVRNIAISSQRKYQGTWKGTIEKDGLAFVVLSLSLKNCHNFQLVLI